MGPDPRAPCIVGVAQNTWRPEEGPAPEPLAQWEQVVRAAAIDAGAGTGDLLGAVDSLQVLYCQSWPYDDPARRLSERLGITPARCAYSGIGGTTPHRLITGAASAIARGELDTAVVVGGEALHTVRMAKKNGESLPWSHRHPQDLPFPFEAPFHPAEVAHEVFQAWLTFALFESARRHHRGVEPDRYRSDLGRILAPMTEVAESNPHAWFRRRSSAAELIEPTPANRMVAYPYTKTMVAIMDVDMAAALVLTSHGKADALGIAQERRVYLRGCSEASDPVYVAEHEPLWSSPAMATAAPAAMAGAGVGIDDVAHLDLYSCFPSSVGFTTDALGLDPSDARTLTVTGGLPFAGGPGSGYLLHSTAAMVDVLRADPGSFGLVSGVGMHMTKHAFDLYCTTPPDTGWHPPGQEAVPMGAGVASPRLIASEYDGVAQVAAYTVVHDRTGAPTHGVAVCDGPDGYRSYARFDDPDLMEWAETNEWVGAKVDMRTNDRGVNELRRDR